MSGREVVRAKTEAERLKSAQMKVFHQKLLCFYQMVGIVPAVGKHKPMTWILF